MRAIPMGDTTAIEWRDATFNPWIGCQHVSPGCDHCYAETQNGFRRWVGEWGPHGERRRTSAAIGPAPAAGLHREVCRRSSGPAKRAR